MTTDTVYLLHIEPSFRHAGHYLGVTRRDRSVHDRLEEHRAGRGAKLCAYAVGAGHKLLLARTWPDAPKGTERHLKGRSLRPLCPICRHRARMDYHSKRLAMAHEATIAPLVELMWDHLDNLKLFHVENRSDGN